MTLNLDQAIVYDIETFPNCFTLHMECLNSDVAATWEISDYRDDRAELMTWFNWLNQTQTSMIGFNNVHFDYPVIHHLFMNPLVPVQSIYEKAMAIIQSNDRFGHTIWASDRFAPQIDLFKINHFDNKAKTTSLKALQINMRLPSVVDMPVEVGTILNETQVRGDLIPYNIHDVKSTKTFAIYNKQAIDFRLSLIPEFGIDVMNWNDTKIGENMIINRLGKELCYDYNAGKKKTRQTPRSSIKIADIIFPYVEFEHPEFQRVLDFLKGVELNETEIREFNGDDTQVLKTKGVLTGLTADVGGMEFCFGTGGIHGSIKKTHIQATDDWLIRDIDVGSLYPSVAIANKLAPEHLGERFVEIYAQLPKERKRWQKEKGKKCVEANTLKLASNGAYGKSNSIYSVFYDPKFTVTITINGQLLLCMLAEQLANIPTLKLLQINTDGITYFIHKDNEPKAAQICRDWEELTGLILEDVGYSDMWLRDVNNYIARGLDGSLKLKGAYWTPDATDYYNSISQAQPPAWHKDLSNLVSVRAAVAAMVHNVDPEVFIRMTTNPYDFMLRAKPPRSSKLVWSGEKIQRTSRYFVSQAGKELLKVMPPAGKEGAYKRANGISEVEYERVMNDVAWEWDERVCTKNKSKYETRRTAIQAGHKVIICNDAQDFDFSLVNYDWYVNEARKLII